MASKTKTRRRVKPRLGVAEAAIAEFKSPLESPTDDQDFEESIATARQKLLPSRWLTFILDSEEDPTTRVRVFPRLGIFSLMALTIFSRHLFLTGFESLGMLEPDENFQAIEGMFRLSNENRAYFKAARTMVLIMFFSIPFLIVAHSEVYGYGFLPHQGYAAGTIRLISNGTTGKPPPTWIYPRMYVLLFRAREFFGWTSAPFVLARRFHGMVAATLPFGIYKFTRTMFGQSRDIALMAATLVAFSKHLMLLGIHPFLQSLISPLIFMLVTIVLKILGANQDCDTDRLHQQAAKPPDLDIASKLGLLLCGIILGVLPFVHADSLLITTSALIVCLIPSHTSRMDALPTVRTLASALLLLCGFFTGIALGSIQDYAVHGQWCWTPLNTIRFLIGSFKAGPTEASYAMYVRSFLSASHVHVAVIIAAVIVSVIYGIHNWRISQIFDGMISSSDEKLFRSTFRITLLSSALLAFYSCQNHQEIRIVHDVIILILIAGSAGVYLLYSSLYQYVMSITTGGKTSRNMVKLILYAELFLYMFEARMTFPTAQNRNIAEWAHGRYWESAYVNQCLKYVGQQTDVTGLTIDYSIEMTGGFSLLHRDVPIYAKSGLGFWEWGARRHDQVSWDEELGKSPEDNVRVSKHVEATDFISLLNPGLLVKRVIEKTHYNYVIVTGGRKFFKKGFREVFNASDTRVFKRSKSRTESEYLLSVVDKIPIGTNVTVLEYEGGWLIALKNYAEAVSRLRTALEINAAEAQLSTWKMLIFALQELNQTTDADKLRKKCESIHGPDCEQHFELDLGELTNHKLDSDSRNASNTYKFPV